MRSNRGSYKGNGISATTEENLNTEMAKLQAAKLEAARKYKDEDLVWQEYIKIEMIDDEDPNYHGPQRVIKEGFVPRSQHIDLSFIDEDLSIEGLEEAREARYRATGAWEQAEYVRDPVRYYSGGIPPVPLSWAVEHGYLTQAQADLLEAHDKLGGF